MSTSSWPNDPDSEEISGPMTPDAPSGITTDERERQAAIERLNADREAMRPLGREPRHLHNKMPRASRYSAPTH
jgi:hypothetical protein